MQLFSVDATASFKKNKILFAQEKLEKPRSINNSFLDFFLVYWHCCLKRTIFGRKEFKGLTISPLYILFVYEQVIGNPENCGIGIFGIQDSLFSGIPNPSLNYMNIFMKSFILLSHAYIKYFVHSALLCKKKNISYKLLHGIFFP